MSESPDDSTGDGPDYRQLSVVALAALAIVLAAFLAPAGSGITSPDDGINPNGEPDAPPNADPGSTGSESPFDGPGDVPDIDIDWFGLLEWFEFDWIDSGDPEPGDVSREEPGTGDGPPVSSCTVFLDSEPTPGSEVTALIRDDGNPITDAEVWYNDEYVGRTDDRGRVTGEVPYAENLVIRVESDDHPACSGSAETARLTAAAIATVGSGTAASASATPTGAPASDRRFASAQQADEVDDGTVEYEVDGEVEIALRGRPDPGETVTVEASIEGVPMADASVTIDGEEVAETDADGTAAVEIPDDGTESFELGVARGDFSGTTTVEVRLLEVALVPEGLAPIPGSPGVVEATIAGEPVADADVTVDGEVVGTTDDDGRLPLALPADPTTAVTVSTDDRTETVSLFGLYGDIAVVLGFAVAGLTAVAFRTHGRRGAAAVVGTAGAALFVLVVEAFYGGAAGGLTLLALAALALAVAYYRSERAIGDDRPSPGDAASGLLEWIVDRILVLVALLERAVDRARVQSAAARAWASSLPRSASALAASFAGWLAALPARALAIGRNGLAPLRRLPLTGILAVLAAGPVIAAGYAVDGARGAAVVAAALGIAGLLYRRRDEESDSAGSDDDGDGSVEPTAETAAAADAADDRRTFRELWRAFARRVEPRRWRTYTPGEIRRTAHRKGYPDRPVDELTTLFREVEYGGRPLSSGVRDRADAAYTELVETVASDEKSDANDGTDGPTAETDDVDGETPEKSRGDGDATDGATTADDTEAPAADTPTDRDPGGERR